MYGALASHALAVAFAVVGVDNRVARILSLLSSLALIALLTAVIPERRSILMRIIAASLFFGLTMHARFYFTEGRPDMLALFLGTLGLVIIYAGYTRRSNLLLFAGTAAIILGVFFKQTAGLFAFVPALAILLDPQADRRQRVLFSVIPPLALAASMLTLKILQPTPYFYMVTLPASYDIPATRLVRSVSVLVREYPLFVTTFLLLCFTPRGFSETDSKTRWILAAVAVCFVGSLLAFAKIGGAPNSLLPALFAMVCFCIVRLEYLRRSEVLMNLTWRGIIPAGMFLALLAAFSPPSQRLEPSLKPNPLESEYALVVEKLRGMKGAVLAPEDPTLTLHALGTAGRNIYLEFDLEGRHQGHWPNTIPAAMLRDLQDADHVVDVHSWFQDVLRSNALRELGYEQTWTMNRYSLWSKAD